MKLYAGTCSYLDTSLAASGFYPRKRMNPAEKLIHYASRLNALEIESTFFTLPDPSAVFNWIVNTPPGFAFGIRCPSLFTFHLTRWDNLPLWMRNELPVSLFGEGIRREQVSRQHRRRLFEEFITALSPLHERKKLGYILFQFPPWWRCSREHLVYLRRVREAAGPLPLAVEIRHPSWLRGYNRDAFLKVLREENIVYTAVDMPGPVGALTEEWPVTAEWGAVVRLHGRNIPAWERQGASMREKRNYNYSMGELEEWRLRCEPLKEKMPCLFLMFNNCVDDHAVRNAQRMKEIMES